MRLPWTHSWQWRACQLSYSAAQLLHARGLSSEGLELEARVLHCHRVALRVPCECRQEGDTDAAPPGHVLRVYWPRGGRCPVDDVRGVGGATIGGGKGGG